MSGGTFQVFTRQLLAIPVDGGLLIAEKVTAATFHHEEGQSSSPAIGAGSSDEQQDKKVSYCCCGFLAFLWAAINIYMIIIGGVSECPVENLIRVYLIVQGSFNLLQLTLCGMTVCANAKDKGNTLSTWLSCFNLILILFFIAWTIVGSVWVWRSLGDWQDNNLVCGNALIVSAMIFLVLHYVVLLLLCCCCTCVFCIACCTSDDE